MSAIFRKDAAGFARTLKRWGKDEKALEALVFRNTVNHVEKSIRFGSAATGAPGQPVKSGDLRDSYIQRGSFAARKIEISSELPYAGIIEHNFRGATLRSKVGGFHSIKITHVNLRWLVRGERIKAKKILGITA